MITVEKGGSKVAENPERLLLIDATPSAGLSKRVDNGRCAFVVHALAVYSRLVTQTRRGAGAKEEAISY